MHRGLESLAGGILGLLAGSLLCAPLVAHVFGPTTVTWDATACPPGVYTITSTATSLTDARSFTTTTQHIRLPKPSIVQDFGDLPVGQYHVSAVARDARGRTFGSSMQTVTGQGPSRGRQSARMFAVPEPHRSPARALIAPETGKTAVSAPAAAPEPAASADPQSVVPQTARLSSVMLDRMIAGASAHDLLASFPWWKNVAFLDRDEDGVMDVVLIEFITGQIWIAAIDR